MVPITADGVAGVVTVATLATSDRQACRDRTKHLGRVADPARFAPCQALPCHDLGGASPAHCDSAVSRNTVSNKPHQAQVSARSPSGPTGARRATEESSGRRDHWHDRRHRGAADDQAVSFRTRVDAMILTAAARRKRTLVPTRPTPSSGRFLRLSTRTSPASPSAARGSRALAIPLERFCRERDRQLGRLAHDSLGDGGLVSRADAGLSLCHTDAVAGARRLGRAPYGQRRDDGLRGAAHLPPRIRIDPLVRSGGRRR